MRLQTIVLLGCLLGGCVSMSPGIKLNQRQFEQIKTDIEQLRRASPPKTEAAATQMSRIYNVAVQGSKLSEVHLKKVGPPTDAVPSPSDLGAVEDFTERYAYAVERESMLKGVLKNYIAKRFGMGDATTGGTIGAFALAAFLSWMKKRKAELVAKQYDDGIQAQDPKDRRKIKLGPEAQAAHEQMDADRKARAVT